MKPLSYSANAQLMSCARKYKHSHVDGFEVFDPNVPAFAGQCMAEALLGLHTTHKAQWILGENEKVHQQVTELLENAWGDFTHNVAKYQYLTVGHLETVLWYYINERNPQQVMPLSEGGQILAEEKATFDWPREWKGELDMVKVTGIPDIPAKVAGQNVIVDWKCSTMYISDFWSKKFSVVGHQLRTYMEMLRHHYGIETTAAYVDGIHMGKKAAESAKAWKSLSTQRSRLIGPFNFTEAQRQETWEWYKLGEEMRKFFAEQGHWPQNEGACGSFSGCEFQKLCGMSPRVREAKGAMLYKIKERHEKNQNEGNDSRS